MLVLVWQLFVANFMLNTELPKPDLAPLSQLVSLCKAVMRATCPIELGCSYEEVKAMDDISVTILPEKKGMLFKHVEYLVESRVRERAGIRSEVGVAGAG